MATNAMSSFIFLEQKTRLVCFEGKLNNSLTTWLHSIFRRLAPSGASASGHTTPSGRQKKICVNEHTLAAVVENRSSSAVTPNKKNEVSKGGKKGKKGVKEEDGKKKGGQVKVQQQQKNNNVSPDKYIPGMEGAVRPDEPMQTPEEEAQTAQNEALARLKVDIPIQYGQHSPIFIETSNS